MRAQKKGGSVQMSYLFIVKLCDVKPGAGTSIIYEHAGYYWALWFQREVEQELMGRSRVADEEVDRLRNDCNAKLILRVIDLKQSFGTNIVFYRHRSPFHVGTKHCFGKEEFFFLNVLNVSCLCMFALAVCWL